MFGDVKGSASRFPREQLSQACGPDSGDWATATTNLTLEDGSVLPVFGWAHRRGGEIHTFISSCGTTLLGNPQKHKDDDLDADTGHILARK